ncbi:P-loop containing nucleoside triphosphate hydrolase [Cladorrhinum sp. PSN259]|nr:P-loop containing nucleoside triphosphate hydrolase [Cladorrhinum sp. PSN259]
MSTSPQEPRGSQDANPDPKSAQDMSHFIILHQVNCSGLSPTHSSHPETAFFRDTPRLFKNDTRADPLRGLSPIADPASLHMQDPAIIFVIYRTYSCTTYHSQLLARLQDVAEDSDTSGLFLLGENGEHAFPEREHMDITSDTFRNAITEVQRSHQGPSDASLDGWDSEYNMLAPYLHFYHIRNVLRAAQASLASPHRHVTGVLLDYLDANFGREYSEADDLFKDSHVTRDHAHKLFGPNQVLLTRENGQLVTILTKNCPLPYSYPIKIECERWSFDGRFAKSHHKVVVPWPRSHGRSRTAKFPISSLAAYPLHLASAKIYSMILDRGKTFWSCRRRRLVGYEVSNQPFIAPVNGRYMVDVNAYRELHGDDGSEADILSFREYLAPELMDADEPPPGLFVQLLPPTIRGFGFHDKKWMMLEVEYIQPVRWHRASHRNLIIDMRETEILTALLQNHYQGITAALDTSDVSHRSNTGVAILLHGAPGTGKTYTAESVVEFAELPLYRLTSADIGFAAADVKKNLETVFNLASAWNAVVLLEDCEVFLEARKIADVQRNAVVSVILGVLQRFKGIAILETSRVGSLDEALTSRFRLAIHFSLTPERRKRLWSNMCAQLAAESDIDVESLQDGYYNTDLLRKKLNATQLANVLRTAQAMAVQAKMRLDWWYVKSILQTTHGLTEYLEKVSGGTARENAMRHRLRFDDQDDRLVKHNTRST